MDSKAFVVELTEQVGAFCRSFDARPPAYSYIPCTTDEQRAMVMKSRFHNELQAADLYGAWLHSTHEFEVKAIMAHSANEEVEHAGLLAERIRGLGHDPFDYRPLPAQTGMFNALSGLQGTCARVAGFPLAGETVATYLIGKSLASDSVPEWIKAPYRHINEEELQHGSIPQGVLERYAVTDELHDAARRAVAMRLTLFKEYMDSLDRWVLEGKSW
jgi:hypothetical protein